MLITAIAKAIATMEGFFTSGTRAARNNNPGNLRDPNGRIWPELPRDSGGFVIFPSASAGWAALERDLGIKAARGWSISQIISAWAPASDGNNTSAYIRYVSGQVGVAPDVPVLTAQASAPASSGLPDLGAALGSDQLLLAAAGLGLAAGFMMALG